MINIVEGLVQLKQASQRCTFLIFDNRGDGSKPIRWARRCWGKSSFFLYCVFFLVF